MARKATHTNTLSKGVLDPDLSERTDLKHRYDSLEDGLNIEFKPQGGFVRRAGTLVNSDADLSGLSKRLRRRVVPVLYAASQVTAHNGGSASTLIDNLDTTFFTTSSVTGSRFIVAEFDLLGEADICFVDVVNFYADARWDDDALAVEFWNGSDWQEMQGAREEGVTNRRHIRERQTKEPVNVNLATTQHVALRGHPVVDDVATDTGMVVLVKNHADPAKNGIYDIPSSGDWTRSTLYNSGAEILQSAFYIASGAINQGTIWANTQQSLRELNDFDGKSIVTFARAPQPGRTRRFASWPGEIYHARYWRVVVRNTAGIGAFRCNTVRFWREKSAVSPVRHFAYDRSADDRYDMVLTERNLDIFKISPSKSRRYVASVPVPVSAHQIDEVTHLQGLDTIMLFHEDVPSWRIVRQGSDVEWNCDELPVYNVPKIKPSAALYGDLDEIQEIDFPGIANNEIVQFFLGDKISGGCVYSVAGMAAGMATVLQNLTGLSPITVTALTNTKFRIRFSGTASRRAWPGLAAVMLNESACDPVHRIVQRGSNKDGPFFGPRTGWPRCGAISQGRLLLAGFRSAPRSWGASSIDSFDFMDDPGPADEAGVQAPPLTPDMAFFRTLDTEQIETIQQIFVGRHLQIFTDSSEWYVESRTLDATQPPNAVRASGVGIKSSVRVIFGEGASIIVQQGGRTVRDFLYDDVEASYKAEPLSLLGPHLLTNVIDVAYAKSVSTQDANMLFFVNEDGSLAIMSMLRRQEVVALSPGQTPGYFRSVAAHSASDASFVVERTSNGRQDLFLEVRDSSCLLDGAIRVTLPVAGSSVTGLGYLEGQEVWAYAGRQLCGPFTVTGGQIDVGADDAATSFVVGRHAAVRGKLHKELPRPGEEMPFRPPARIYEAGLALRETGQIEISTDGVHWRDVPLAWMDGAPLDPGQIVVQPGGLGPERPMLDRLVTGSVTIDNLRGWSRYPQLHFRQSVPAPLHVKAIRLEIAGKG